MLTLGAASSQAGVSYSWINRLTPVVCWFTRPAPPSALCRAGEVERTMAKPVLDRFEAVRDDVFSA
jgi:hypothetical protein